MSDDAIRTATDLDADPDLVWEALTSPDGVASWLGEGSHLVPESGAALDVADVETGVRKVGRVEQVDPGRRLTFVWWPEGDDPDTGHRVDVVLTPSGHGGGDGTTTLTITEAPLSARASIAGAPWAWRAAGIELALLAPRLACVGTA
ncbi:SRPBCC family protein [Actinomarinicola tropica]|nr:SRPBCC domain-containing protein [Actinomarinicola tropica]